MMGYVNNLLKERDQMRHPLTVAVVGAGWYGSGVIQELLRWPGMTPRVVFSRKGDQAVAALLAGGVHRSNIVVASTAGDMRREIANRRHVVIEQTELLNELSGIDVIFEATGDMLFGAQVAMTALQQRIHFVTINSELDGTVGFILHKIFQDMNVVYSNSDGDQPGVLMRMIDNVRAMGFQVTVAGNCKGFLDPYKTPVDVQPWVRPGHNARMVTAFTDGTKQSLELTVLANSTDLFPDIRGMHGPTVTKETLVTGLLDVVHQQGAVEYVMGIEGVNQGAGVFVVAERSDDRAAQDMAYLKMGDGPHYLFFKDNHLCYFESPTSIAEAGLLNMPTMYSKTLNAGVLTLAKKDLRAGEALDGIGGYTVFGQIDREDVLREERLLPVGLSEFAVMTQPLERGAPITYSMVDFPTDNVLLRLAREQATLWSQMITPVLMDSQPTPPRHAPHVVPRVSPRVRELEHASAHQSP